MRLKFTPEMFAGMPQAVRQQAVDAAQLHYDLWVAQLTPVFGIQRADGTINWGFNGKWKNNTHAARLDDIKKIGDR